MIIYILSLRHAQIAQLVEQWTENPRVTGSIPVLGTICASGSVVEHRLAKARVASSNLVFRSIILRIPNRYPHFSYMANFCEIKTKKIESYIGVFEHAYFSIER